MDGLIVDGLISLSHSLSHSHSRIQAMLQGQTHSGNASIACADLMRNSKWFTCRVCLAWGRGPPLGGKTRAHPVKYSGCAHTGFQVLVDKLALVSFVEPAVRQSELGQMCVTA